MLERLELNFFKKHEHLTIDFAGGLNGIVGKNYHGKSTILQGILFCLGGARMVPGVRLATRGTNSGFKQRLWFTIEGKGRYLVERTKTSANLARLDPEGDQELVASGAGPVNNAMAELLGMPLRRFAQIKYAKQKAADAILKYGSTELFKIITEITGLERIGTVLDKVTADLSVQRKVVEALPLVELAAKRDELAVVAQQLKHALSDERAVKETLADQVTMHDRLVSQEKQLQADVNSLQLLTRDMRQADGLFSSCRSRKESVEARLAELHTSAEQLKGDHPDLGVACAAWEKQRQALLAEERESRTVAADVAALTREVSGLDDHDHDLEEALEDAQTTLDVLGEPQTQERLDSLREALQSLKEQHAVTASALRQAKTALASGACPACDRPFEHFDCASAESLVAEHAATLATLDVDIEAAAEDLMRTEAALKAWNKAHAVVINQEDALRDFRERAQKSRARLAEQSTRLTELTAADLLQGFASELEQRLEKGRQVQSTLQHKEEEHVVAQRDYKAASTAQASAAMTLLAKLKGIGAEDLDQVSQRLEEVQEMAAARARDVSHFQTLLEAKRLEVHSSMTTARLLEQALTADEANNAKSLAAEALAQQLEELQQFIRKNRDRYSKQVWDVFMASASQFASATTGGVIEALSRDASGAFTFLEEGFDMALEEGSGAQLAIIGCAVQMALAEAAQSPLNILLMDEPTADMDPEHALAFSTMLASSGKQVVLVTHRELDGAVFDHLIAL